MISGGTTHDEHKDCNPSVKINWVTKTANQNRDDNTITYTIKVNDGNVKTDLTGFTLKDVLSTNQSYPAQITVKNITTGSSETINPGETGFNYGLSGKNQYEITYTTNIDTAGVALGSSTPYNNDVDVTKDNEHHTATTKGDWVVDNRSPIHKTLENQPSNINGNAKWKVVIDPTDTGYNYLQHLVFKDELANSNYSDALNDYDHDSLVVKYDGNIITDYTVEWNEAGKKPTLQITFTDQTQYTKPIEITYESNLIEGADGNYKEGEYKNYAQIHFNDNKWNYDEQSFEISNDTAIKKKAGTPVWNADLNAYVVTWTITANCVNDWDQEGRKDYGVTPMNIVDTLPEGLTYVKDSAKLKYLPYSEGNIYKDYTPVSMVVKGQQLSVEATEVHKQVVLLQYQTKVDNDILYNTDEDGDGIKDSSVKFSNIVGANVGSESLGTTKGNVDVSNQILEKTSNLTGGHIINYKIEVNAHALKLSNSNKLVLEDILDPHTSFVLGTFDIKDSNGISVLDDCELAINSATKDGMPTQMLAISIPDEKALTITYEANLEGNVGDKYTVNNEVNISGINTYQTNDQKQYQVASSAVSGSGIADSITIHKVDQYNLTKNLSGAKFKLYKVNLNNSNPLPGEMVREGTTDGNGKLQFKTNEYGDELELDVLYYFVESEAPTSNDPNTTYILDSTPHYVMLRGDSDAFNTQLQIAEDKIPGITISNSASYVVTNASTPNPTKITLNAKKQLEDQSGNKTSPDDQVFKFALNSTTTPKGVDPIQLTANNNGEKISFKDIQLTKEGHYVFNMSEVNGVSNAEGYALDTTQYQVSFDVVTISTENTLIVDQSSIKYTKAGQDIDPTNVVFVNTSTAVGSIELIKNVTDHNGDALKTTGDYYIGVFNGNTLVGQTHKITLKNESTGSAIASNLPLGSYSIYETDKDGHKIGDAFDYFTVTGNGTSVTVVQDKVTQATPPIVNKMTSQGTYKFKGTKNITGRDYQTGDTYSFTITSDHNGYKNTQTIKPSKGTSASFEFIEDTFDETDIGKTYTYKIKENTGSIPDITYDQTEYTVKLKVSDDNHDGKLEFKVTKDEQDLKENDILFTNTYKSLHGQVVFGGTKVIENRDFKKDEQNTFKLYVDKDGKGYQLLQTKTYTMNENSSQTNFKFDPIIFSQEEIGKTYTYKMIESVGTDTHIQYDTKEYTGTYEIKEANNAIALSLKSGTDLIYNEGTIASKIIHFFTAGDVKQNALFTNKYAPSNAEANFSITKRIEGNEAPSISQCNGFFTFDLKPISENAPMPANTQTNNANSVVSFDTISYTKAGQYKYVINETSVNDHEGFAISKSAIYVVVDVTEDKNAEQLNAKVTYYDDENLSQESSTPDITNKYPQTTPVVQHLEIEKNITGTNAPATDTTTDYFTFEVSKGNDEAILPERVSVTNQGSKVVFEDVTYEKEGQYKYKIQETSVNNHAGFKTSDKVIYALVDVVKVTGQYRLKATVHYYSDSGYKQEVTQPTITNTYTAPTPIATHLEISKAITGTNAPAIDTTTGYFTFEVSKGNDEAILPTPTGVTNTGSLVTFGDMTYTKAGTYKYVISETAIKEGHPEFTLSTDKIYAIVTVTNSPQNKLVSQVQYYSDSGYTKEVSQPTITNEYKEIKAPISLTKLSAADHTTPLANAHYGVYSAETCQEDQLLAKIVTDEKGQGVTDVKFEPGTYYVQEIKAPTGYTVSSTVFPVVVGTTGETAVVETNKDTPYVADAQTHITITKTDINSNKLSGATLQIIDSQNVVIKEWVTTDKTYDFVGELVAGQTYTLHEVKAPEGYELASDVEFTVDEYDDQVTDVVMVDKKKPNTPNTPNTPDTPDNPKETPKDNKVDTGDDSPTSFYFVSLLISTLGYFVIKRKRIEE